MSSIIEGYNYDIFISYRQKDNKHDGWVTEFVNNLKGELESTFKEEISVYFDINPHDGLLETHDVSESLKDKLKCLIFIPIISRIYCDQKSFAWEHEFRAFIKMASKDQFGLKVKLQNGNVASRVLPIQIHELDPEDKKCIEEELGGHLRGIEFIYKEHGVERSLKPEDREEKNLCTTKYNNQINKVAHAVRSIISGLKQQSGNPEIPKKNILVKSRKPNKNKLIFLVLIILFVLAAGGFLLYIIPQKSSKIEKSIAVLPFINNSPDNRDVYFINGFLDEIITNLQSIRSFDKVLPRNSIEKYRNTLYTIPEIAKELDVNYLISGSGQKIDSAYRIIITLTNSKNKILWAQAFEGIVEKDIFKTYVQIAKAIANKLNSVISTEEMRLMNKTPRSLTAYDFYLQGKEELSKYWLNNDIKALEKAENIFNKALAYDASFALAYTGLARVYHDKTYNTSYYSGDFLDSVLILANTAVSMDENIAEAYVLRGDYYRDKGNINKSLEEYEKALSINPNSWEAYAGMGRLFWSIDQIKMIENLEKAASLNHGKEYTEILQNLIIGYNNSGFSDKALNYADEIIKSTRDSLEFLRALYNIYYDSDLPRALEIAQRILVLDSLNTSSQQNYHSVYTPGPVFYFYIANGYRILGQKEISLKYFKREIEVSEKYPDFPIQPGSEHRIGYAYWVVGDTATAGKYIRKSLNNSLKMNELGRGMSLVSFDNYDIAADYAFLGQKDKAFEYLMRFSEKKMMPLDILSLIKMDPLFDNIRSEPEFHRILKVIEGKYQAEHERVRKWLEENNML